ncbi:hypothetical protein ABFS82_10G066400 [Erythranthe guttata]
MAKVIGCSVMIITIWLVAIAAPVAEVESSAITCGGVLTSGAVTTGCCDGLKSLNNAASTTPELQAACRCLTALIPSVSANPSLINNLPDLCGIPFPYRYSASLDCSK